LITMLIVTLIFKSTMTFLTSGLQCDVPPTFAWHFAWVIILLALIFPGPLNSLYSCFHYLSFPDGDNETLMLLQVEIQLFCDRTKNHRSSSWFI
jgi:hypothetical protein